MNLYNWIICFVCSGSIACKSNTNPYANNLKIEPSVLAETDTAHYTSVQWQDSVYNFGTIAAGDPVHAKHSFTNVGSTPLFILNTRTTCGCTITDFPREPTMPGKSGVISVTFKSNTRRGKIDKSIVVVANTKG